MFNHPSHGSMTSQIAQIQRTMACRLQGSNNFLGNMNTPTEMNDRRFTMGWNRGFGSANLMGRSEFNNCGVGSSVPYPPTEMNHQTSGGEFIGNSSIRMPVFKCPECSIVKNTSEDFEIHVKVEHLNWLPFICPLCTATRASDIQMREHLHSFHKKNENRYIYQDNAQAKKILQEMMDKALFGASLQHRQISTMHKLGRIVGESNASLQNGVHNDSAKRIRLDDVVAASNIRKNIEESLQSKNQNVITTSTNSSTSVAKLVGQEHRHSIDEETDSQLSTIFGRNVKSEFDLTAMEEDSHSQQSLQTPNEDDELHDNNSHQMSALQNVAAMFSASGSACQKLQPKRVLDTCSSRPFPYKRVVRNRPGPMTSKKRVLGVCARCNKPITAGARQMHMFFHLGKDMKTFRFRCKHSGCDVEHYRKDQMENHQSKVHGQVDPNMMDDRSQELYNLVQKMSMELLGTMGNTPGPTAAKAQLMYEQQMREVAANLGTRRQPPIRLVTQQMHTNISGMFDSANRKMEDLECRLCHKTIMSRIRGFHILWHLNNDLGIVRYGCKHCNFKHDRPQSVVAHGTREHSDEYCCEDLLYNFEDELKSMSKACFGVERLFEKEIRRRTRLEICGNIIDDEIGGEDELDDDDSRASYDSKLLNQTQIAKLDMPLRAENSDRSWSSPKEQMRRKRSFRRFGTRVRSRRQREDMIKLREVSMRLGGAQYFKKKSNEAVLCEKCGKMISNRLSDHAYSHLDGCDLFRCQQCNLGHYSRETIVRHLRDFHGFHNSSDEPPLDNRLRFAQEIKDAIRECYPHLFVDAPIPTKEDIEKMKANLKLEKMVLISDGEESGNEDKGEEVGEEDEDEEQEDEVEDEDDQNKDDDETHIEADSAKEVDTHEEEQDEENDHDAEEEREDGFYGDGHEKEEGEQEDDGIKERNGEDEVEVGGVYDNEEKHKVVTQVNVVAQNNSPQKRSKRGRPPKDKGLE